MKNAQDAFEKFRNPKRGDSNPHDMTNAFWVWAVQDEGSAYTNNEQYNGPSSCDAGPCWSFDRFGQTTTTLPDSRTIKIGGEHEDSYDPDFYIYNDVTVISPDGEITIYGYPKDVFPPTDFHSATLVDDEIVIIGSLGYPDSRDPTRTQVLRLCTKTWKIISQETSNAPGWISSHLAERSEDGQKIRITDGKRATEDELIEVFATWELNLKDWKWKCLERKNWTQISFSREDGEANQLFEIRHSLWGQEHGMNTATDFSFMTEDFDGDDEMLEEFKTMQRQMEADDKQLKESTDFGLLPTLYHPSVSFLEVPEPDPEFDSDGELIDDPNRPYNHYLIEINGITIRFIEDSYEVTMRVEGELPDETLRQITSDICTNLEKLEKTSYVFKSLPVS